MSYNKIHIYLVLGGVIWLLFLFYLVTHLYQYYYPEPKQEAIKLLFLDKKKVPDHENLEFSLIGLFSPAKVNDIHLFGVRAFESAIDEFSGVNRNYISTNAELPKNTNSLLPVFDKDKLHCWLWDLADQKKDCYSTVDVLGVLTKNKILIERYGSLHRFKYIDSFIELAASRTDLMSLQKLYLSKIKADLISGNDKSVLSLLEDVRLYENILRNDESWVGKAIYMVMLGTSHALLEDIISQYPHLAKKYYEPIKMSLNSFQLHEFDIDGVIRKEFEMINGIFCFDKHLNIKTDLYCQSDRMLSSYSAEFIFNDYYDDFSNLKDILKLDINIIDQQCNELDSYSDVYIDILLHLPLLPNYPAYRFLKSGLLKGCRVMTNMKFNVSNNAFLNVLVDIKAKRINDKDIQEFLNMRALYEPLTNTPFVYSTETKSLEFPAGLPDFVKMRSVRLYN